jgi:hypothetical protein
MIHVFFISALVGGEWSASRPSRFTPGERAPRCPLDRRLGGPQNRSLRLGEETILDPTGTRNSDPSSYILYTDLNVYDYGVVLL